MQLQIINTVSPSHADSVSKRCKLASRNLHCRFREKRYIFFFCVSENHIDAGPAEYGSAPSGWPRIAMEPTVHRGPPMTRACVWL